MIAQLSQQTRIREVVSSCGCREESSDGVVAFEEAQGRNGHRVTAPCFGKEAVDDLQIPQQGGLFGFTLPIHNGLANHVLPKPLDHLIEGKVRVSAIDNTSVVLKGITVGIGAKA